MNVDEKDLFHNAVNDVKPLKASSQIHWQQTLRHRTRQDYNEAQLDNPLIRYRLEIIPRAEPLEFKVEGIQQGVLDKIRSGKYSLDASLNLLHQPVESCRQLLWRFIYEAEKASLRNLLIIHGKGRDDKSHANVVRSYLATWLMQFDQIQAFCSAQPHHGGAGACYVSLRKSSSARDENRERHAKRSR